METKKLLEVRATIKARKPEFNAQDSHKKKRVQKKWKRPTGLQSKMRHQFKGYARRVKQGWRSPVEIRGFHGTNVDAVVVTTIADIQSLKKGQAALIARTVGTRKKLVLIAKAEELKIPVVNIKTEQFKNQVSAKIDAQKQEKNARDSKKKKTIEESLKNADKKDAKKSDAKSDTADAEDKKAEKKIKDDTIIHKE